MDQPTKNQMSLLDPRLIDAQPADAVPPSRNHLHGGSLASPADDMQSGGTDMEASQVGAAITKIEDILADILDALAHNREPLIPFQSRRSSGVGSNSVRFPGKTNQEAKKFARLLTILRLAHGALASGRLLTKRNIYYQNQDLFDKQSTVDQLVDDLSFTLGLGRDGLNVVAAGKGLAAGPVRIALRDGSPLGFSSASSGVLIPPRSVMRGINIGSAQWALVIEKEATFRTLSESQYWRYSLAGEGILVTGKGYPDLATRSFLSDIHSVRPDLPIYMLADYDPDGLNILACYRHGSQSLDHEDALTVPGLRWLGIHSSHLLEMCRLTTTVPANMVSPPACRYPIYSTGMAAVTHQRGDEGSSQESNGSLSTTSSWSPPRRETALPLSPRDRKCAAEGLARMQARIGHGVDEVLAEFQVMLMLNYKCEIQAVDTLGDMTDWLDVRLANA